MRPLLILLLCASFGVVVENGADDVAAAVAAVIDADDAHGEKRGCDGCDDDDENCSPACPTCVYAQGIRVVQPASPTLQMAPDITVWVLAEMQGPAVDVRRAPSAPEGAGVFHPPRPLHSV